MSKTGRIPDYLLHIVQAIARIQEYTASINSEEFYDSQLIQDAVIRNLEIIGEATGRIYSVLPGFLEDHPEIPWKAMRGMRNLLAHDYANIDCQIVWQTVSEELPVLKEKIAKLLNKED